MPVVVLTARGGLAQRIEGLRQGADGYVTKPFSPIELVLRVRGALHRAAGSLGAGPGQLRRRPGDGTCRRTREETR